MNLYKTIPSVSLRADIQIYDLPEVVSMNPGAKNQYSFQMVFVVAFRSLQTTLLNTRLPSYSYTVPHLRCFDDYFT